MSGAAESCRKRARHGILGRVLLLYLLQGRIEVLLFVFSLRGLLLQRHEEALAALLVGSLRLH